MDIDSGKLSTDLITAVAIITGFIAIYPDATSYILSNLGASAGVVGGIITIGIAIYNYMNPRKTDSDK